jgi:biopolymer transport protein ExbD
LANLAGNPETRGKAVSIKCAEESPHKALVNVLDILYKHNFKRVYLWTL